MIDTRDLAEKRDDLKQQILDDFLDQFEHYADQTEEFEDILFEEEELESFREDWGEELAQIKEIDELEDEVESYSGDGFECGTTLIEEYKFTDYCKDFCEDVGFVSSDLPALIDNNINWSGVADDMRYDYTEVEFRGTDYLFR